MGTTIIDKFITKAEFYGMTSIIREVQLLIQNYEQLAAVQMRLGNFDKWSHMLLFVRRMSTEIKALGFAIGGLFLLQIGISSLKVREEFEGLRIQMNAIFHDAEKGKQAFDWAVDYANRTPFNVDEVIRGVKTLASKMIQPTEKNMNILGGMAKLSAGRTIEDAVRAVSAGGNNQFGMLRRSFNLDKQNIKQITGKDIDKLTNKMDRIALILEAAEKRAPGLIGMFSMSLVNARTNMEGQWQIFLDKIGQIIEPTAIKGFEILGSILSELLPILNLIKLLVDISRLFTDNLFNFIKIAIGMLTNPFKTVADIYSGKYVVNYAEIGNAIKDDYSNFTNKKLGIPAIPKYGEGGLDPAGKLIQQVVGKGDIAQIGVKLTEFGKSGNVHRPLTIKIDSKDGSPLSKAMADIAIKTIKDAVAQKKLNLEFN